MARQPVTDRDWNDAHLINAARDIHHDDPEFGYRFIADELEQQGVCGLSQPREPSLQPPKAVVGPLAQARHRAPARPARPRRPRQAEVHRPGAQPALAHRHLRAPTAEGKLYLCAVKDACSNRIVGYSLDARMTADLAVRALRNALALRGRADVLEVVVHSDRGSQFRSTPTFVPSQGRKRAARWGGSGLARTTLRWSRSSLCCRRTSSTAGAGRRAKNCAWRS